MGSLRYLRAMFCTHEGVVAEKRSTWVMVVLVWLLVDLTFMWVVPNPSTKYTTHPDTNPTITWNAYLRLGHVKVAEDRLDVLGKAHLEHFVGLVQYDVADVLQTQRPAVEVVHDAACGWGVWSGWLDEWCGGWGGYGVVSV